MTTANKITIARILLVPFFVVFACYYINSENEWFRLGALASFVIAALSDGLDGYVARHYNQRTELGTVLDPLADKVLLVAGIVILTLDTHGHFLRIPWWWTGTILGRDVLVVGGIIAVRCLRGKVKLHPRPSGKAASVLQMLVVIWILLKWHEQSFTILSWLQIMAGVLTIFSGLLYLWDAVQQLRDSRGNGSQR